MNLVWNRSSLNVVCEKDLPLLKGKMENWLQLGKESYQLVPPKTLVKIPQRHEPEEIPASSVFHVLLVKFLQPFQSKKIQQNIDIANVYFFKNCYKKVLNYKKVSVIIKYISIFVQQIFYLRF